MLAFHRAATVALVCVLGGPALAQTTWFVDAAAVPPGNGTPGSPYASIQYALEQAGTVTGDTLNIAAGTYAERVSQPQTKAVNWLAPAGPLLTSITGGVTLGTIPFGVTTFEGLAFLGEPLTIFQAEVVLRGCHVRDVDSPFEVYSLRATFSTVTLEDCVVAGNSRGGISAFNTALILDGVNFAGNGPNASALDVSGGSLLAEDCGFFDNDVVEASGGAIALSTQQATLRNCDFEGNSAYLGGRYGGAIYQFFGNATVEDCTFTDNRSDRGGAITAFGLTTLTVTGSTFTGNVAQRDGSGQFQTSQGGAIWVGMQGVLTADDCEFLVNSAPTGLPLLPDDQLGGAIFAEGQGSTVRNSLFADNVSGQTGSAVWGPVTLVRCRIQQNVNTVAGGAAQGASLDRCTVIKNGTGFGTAAVLDSNVINSIVWANANGQLGGTSSASYSCIQGGAPGIGNIAADPQFTDLGNEIVTLTVASPCIDAASPSAPLDLDLTPADMGALPFTWQPIGASYCNTNPNSSGQTAQIAALGSISVADDFLRVQATQTAVNQFGLFMMSQNQGFVPFFNGSQGNLCVSAPIVRLTNTPGSVSSSGALGLLNLRVGLTTLPAGLQVLPGQTWHFQSWFRDNVGGNSTSNTSDAVSVTFQ